MKKEGTVLLSLLLICFMAGVGVLGFEHVSQQKLKTKKVAIKKVKPKKNKVRYTKKVIPMFSYSKNLKAAKPLQFALVDNKPIYVFFKPTKNYKSINIKCCNEIDNTGEPIGQPEINMLNKAMKVVFTYDLTKEPVFKRELLVDSLNKKGEYESKSFLFYVEQPRGTLASN